MSTLGQHQQNNRMLTYSQEEEEAFFDQLDQVYVLAESDKKEEAEALLLEIERKVPDPKSNCSIGKILLDGIFAFYEQTDQLEKALPFFLRETALLKEEQSDRPARDAYAFLSTGNIYFALQDLDQARTNFQIAFQLGKKAVFGDFNTDFLFLAVASEEDFQHFKENFLPVDGQEEELDELSDQQQELIDEYCGNGDKAMIAENFPEAAEWYSKAYQVLPDPKEDWESTGYISGSLGDALFCAGRFREALEPLETACDFYGADDTNPFILLRRGQCHLELGEQDKALSDLLRAYQLEGPALFEEEPKYLKFLKQHHQLKR